MLEYVVLGDFQTAVGFLLASPPERSARYYRDALCTLALAVCTSAPFAFISAFRWHQELLDSVSNLHVMS